VQLPTVVPKQGTPVPPAVMQAPPTMEAPIPPTTTIYLCRSYAGGSFWSDTTCHQQRATIDRMTSVPSSLSFSEQVAIAQGQANEAARLYVAPVPGPAAGIGGGATNTRSRAVCPSLALELENLDAMARQPQPAQMQDWIRQRRMQVQDQRTAYRC